MQRQDTGGNEPTPKQPPMAVQQRVIWIGLAIILLTIPVWFDAVVMPGDYVFIWRWTESQIIFESLITVGFLIAAIVGFFVLRKAALDWQYWKIARLGVSIWIAMLVLLTLFSLLIYYAGDQDVRAEFEGEGFTVSALGSGVEENSQFFVVMSCDQRGMYKRVIHIDRFIGADDVEFRADGENLNAHYTIEGRELRYQTYVLPELYQQCLTGESPRPFEQ
ncbi:hypothetical protein CWE13_07210 [Aliidiomarina shirensis]|uniref:Uncharacterized protein n=1 Tax=Aliidiomarina shirensis TaxID=1048642 RepID=A0A432WVD3_9GAMM|nr:hypothetical protein [Aliidiomarina shirensis]RUO37728.1 hypothetical protein CWE13_07210 [Aliidiomarina shirensis]